MPTFPLIIASVFADDFADKATFMENAPKVKFAALFLMTYHLLLFISEMMFRLLYILPGKMYLVIRLVRFYGLDWIGPEIFFINFDNNEALVN